jgi:acetyl esterase/lipase
MRLRDAGEALPGCAVLLSPWTDMRCRSDSYQRNAAIDPIASYDIGKAMGLGYVGPGGDLDNPLASPLIGDLRNLPPLLLQAGSREVFLDEPTTIGERVRAAGGEAVVDIWPGMIHQFQLHVGRLDEAEAAVEVVGEFVRRNTGG